MFICLCSYLCAYAHVHVLVASIIDVETDRHNFFFFRCVDMHKGMCELAGMLVMAWISIIVYMI